MKVFLSHSSKDKELARKIANDLTDNKIEVWFDEWEICVGDSITQKISEGLADSAYVAVLLSQNSTKSGWVEKEWQSKVGIEAAKNEVAILPLKADGCEIPTLLQDKLYADFSSSYQQGITKVINSIEKFRQAPSEKSGQASSEKFGQASSQNESILRDNENPVLKDVIQMRVPCTFVRK